MQVIKPGFDNFQYRSYSSYKAKPKLKPTMATLVSSSAAAVCVQLLNQKKADSLEQRLSSDKYSKTFIKQVLKLSADNQDACNFFVVLCNGRYSEKEIMQIYRQTFSYNTLKNKDEVRKGIQKSFNFILEIYSNPGMQTNRLIKMAKSVNDKNYKFAKALYENSKFPKIDIAEVLPNYIEGSDEIAFEVVNSGKYYKKLKNLPTSTWKWIVENNKDVTQIDSKLMQFLQNYAQANNPQIIELHKQFIEDVNEKNQIY